MAEGRASLELCVEFIAALVYRDYAPDSALYRHLEPMPLAVTLFLSSARTDSGQVDFSSTRFVQGSRVDSLPGEVYPEAMICRVVLQ